MATSAPFALIRSYELDVYDHVSNAVPSTGLSTAAKFLQDKGFNYISIVDQWRAHDRAHRD